MTGHQQIGCRRRIDPDSARCLASRTRGPSAAAQLLAPENVAQAGFFHLAGGERMAARAQGMLDASTREQGASTSTAYSMRTSRSETAALTAAAMADVVPTIRVTSSVLRAFPMFADTPDATCEAVAHTSTLRRVPRFAQVIRAGERTDFVYLIVSGQLNVLVGDEQGREGILAMLRAGELFGEMAAIGNQACSASVIAATPSVLVVMGKTDFNRLMKENADVARYVMCKLIQRLRMANRTIESLALLDVGGRVARVLQDMAETVNGERVVSSKISKQSIAKMVGASREMVSRVVKEMQLNGRIEIDEGLIVLHDVDSR